MRVYCEYKPPQGWLGRHRHPNAGGQLPQAGQQDKGLPTVKYCIYWLLWGILGHLGTFLTWYNWSSLVVPDGYTCCWIWHWSCCQQWCWDWHGLSCCWHSLRSGPCMPSWRSKPISVILLWNQSLSIFVVDRDDPLLADGDEVDTDSEDLTCDGTE